MLKKSCEISHVIKMNPEFIFIPSHLLAHLVILFTKIVSSIFKWIVSDWSIFIFNLIYCNNVYVQSWIFCAKLRRDGVRIGHLLCTDVVVNRMTCVIFQDSIFSYMETITAEKLLKNKILFCCYYHYTLSLFFKDNLTVAIEIVKIFCQ